MTNQKEFSIKSLFSDILVYGIARYVNAFLSIFLIPIYTRYFTVAEYGIIENLNIFNIVIVSLFGLSLSEGVFRYYTLSDSIEEKKKILSTVHYISIVSGILAVVIGVSISGWFGEIFIQKSNNENFLLILLASIQAFFVINLTVYQSVLRIKFKRFQYNVSTIGAVILSALLSIVFVVVLNYGIISVFLASVIANFIFTMYGYWQIKEEISLCSVHFKILQNILPYCYPLIIASFSLLIMRSSDRYFMALMLPDSLHQIGLYTTAEKVMTPLLIITAAFHTAFVPFILNAAKTQDIKPLLVKSYKLYISATTIFVIIFSMLSKYLLMLLTTPSYYPAYQFTYLVGIYLILNVSYYFGSIGLVLKEKTKYIGMYVMGSSICNIILNSMLIPQFGIEGAFWATIIAYGVLNILIFYKSDKLYPVDFGHLKTYIILILSGCISYFALDNLALGILLLGLFIACLFYFDYLKREYLVLLKIREYFVKREI